MLSLPSPHLNVVRKSISRIRIYHVGGIRKCFKVLSGVKGVTVGKHLEKLTKIMGFLKQNKGRGWDKSKLCGLPIQWAKDRWVEGISPSYQVSKSTGSRSLVRL